MMSDPEQSSAETALGSFKGEGFLESFLPVIGIFACFLKGKGKKKKAHNESLNFQKSHLAFSKACVKI